MLPKAIITFLIGLHLLPPSQNLNPTNPNLKPVPTPITQNSNISVADEVYADLALQHELNHISLYYFDDKPQDTLSLNSSKNWDPASTIKLYVAMYAFDQIAHGNISLNQAVTIADSNVAASESYSNGYPDLNAEDNVSVFRLLDQMITQSDNTAYNTLLDLLDRREITKYIHDLGLTNSSVGAKLNLDQSVQQNEFATAGYGPNLITAEDYAKAFILINGGRIPGSTDLFNILSRQKLNTMLPALLPKTVTVAHKTGELDPLYHDGGIVVDPTSNRKYVLSVFSDLGDPSIVAHISNLVYTTDINIVGNNQKNNQSVSEVPSAPIDPMVANGQLPANSEVLAANTQNVKLPKVTASDLGITEGDLSGVLGAKQLPPVLIAADSPLHFLVNLGEQLRININPVPALRTQFEADNLKQSLSEANDLIKRGKTGQANSILSSVDQKLSQIASESTVPGNVNLQTAINQVSETRFAILQNEVTSSSQDQKVQLIKEVARQAVNTAQNVKPQIADAIKSTELSQTPVVGQVVSSTQNSITVKTAEGTTVTTPVNQQVIARQSGDNTNQVLSPIQLAVGSTIAVTPNFVLTNISSESANPKPVTVVKVNLDTNTLVVTGPNGVPQQIDLTKTTVIKGADTSISLSQVQPGDLVVVHGEPLPPPATKTASGSGSPTPTGSSSPNSSGANNGNGNNNSNGQGNSQQNLPIPGTTTTPIASSIPGQTTNASSSGTTSNTPIASVSPVPNRTSIATPATSSIPSKTTTPVSTTPQNKITPAPAKSAKPTTPTPQVIKGNVIQVVPVKNEKPGTSKPKVSNTPNPIPPATPAGKH